MSDLVQQRHDDVLWLTIDRQAQRNALSPAIMEALAAAITQAGDDRALRAIVLTGAGDRAFCAGADLQGDSFKFDYAEPSLPYANLLRAAHHSRLPLIARVGGACVAGGMGLLAMCDMAVAANTARFGLPEVKVGVFPMQVLALLQRIVPSRVLYELCYTGALFRADRALSLGLVNDVVPPEQLDARLDELLAQMKDKSPAAIRRGRYAMRTIESMSFHESIAFMESQIGLMSMTDDAREGMQAFAEKRSPHWTGN
ncbi:enoyl-CoA hydratase-related protein [Bordetella sp. BOR01]|uniref:enoyl-CoA hydratase-related protein n=1 Tax=Bordetella sp. BOR01 TaxID=2854779 RepID=UPI001C43A624|nr:enoyl-CoA hydratase-related protein [Bordetella sp. BOR01]MBV7482359.1 enoyl-CoA hydratase/isomerase family protein [Bordetella sp. BOR01]